jgi:hypothetical protein
MTGGMAASYYEWEVPWLNLHKGENCRCWSSGLSSLALKKKTVFSSETLVSTYKSTWRYNPEDQLNCSLSNNPSSCLLS